MNEINLIAQIIYDKKGFNILAIDVRRVSPVTEYLIIAEGNVERHTMAIADAIREKAKESGLQVLQSEGEQKGDWIVFDLGSVMVHLFTPALRQKYCLEKLWHEGVVVDLKLAKVDA